MKVDSTSKIKKDGDKIVVTINETQTKTQQEFDRDIQQKKSLLGQYMTQLADTKAKLVDVMDVEEDEETKKVAEMLEKAEKVKAKKALMAQLKFTEEQIAMIEKNLKEMTL